MHAQSPAPAPVPNEFFSLCLRAGELQYNISEFQRELVAINDRLRAVRTSEILREQIKLEDQAKAEAAAKADDARVAKTVTALKKKPEAPKPEHPAVREAKAEASSANGKA